MLELLLCMKTCHYNIERDDYFMGVHSCRTGSGFVHRTITEASSASATSVEFECSCVEKTYTDCHPWACMKKSPSMKENDYWRSPHMFQGSSPNIHCPGHRWRLRAIKWKDLALDAILHHAWEKSIANKRDYPHWVCSKNLHQFKLKIINLIQDISGCWEHVSGRNLFWMPCVTSVIIARYHHKVETQLHRNNIHSTVIGTGFNIHVFIPTRHP